jgi:hypothetical protein
LKGRLALVALAAACLVAGVGGGLLRLGWSLDAPSAAVFHGPLMVSGFLGTVISLERAVALGTRWAYLAPLLAGVSALLLVCGYWWLAAVPWVAAPLVLYAASVAIWRKQPMLHTGLLAGASLAWLAAQGLALSHASPDAFAAWAFTFLVLTIAAERMEMTRLLKPRPLSRPLFALALVPLLAGAAATVWFLRAGAVLYGLGLVALAAWLATFDLARRTVRAEGLGRFSAVALLAGYAWLAVAGVAWASVPFAGAWLRDAALHALGLGFVFSMIFAHAPIILPAVAKVKVPFSRAFYLPLALLHASVLTRVFLGAAHGEFRQWSGALNAVAIVLFVAMVAWRVAVGRKWGPKMGSDPN